MSDTTLFGYHPVTGKLLTANMVFVPGYVSRNITQVDGELLMEDGSETDMEWDASDDQTLAGDYFLVDDTGNECLASEAIWRGEELDRIDPPAGLTATGALCPQYLRDYLHGLVTVVKEVLDGGDLHGDAANALRGILAQKLR